MFIRALTRSGWFALACATAFIAIFEIRDYHDSAFSYFILYPVIVAVGSLSCYFAVTCSERTAQASWAPLLPVAALNALGILTYEMALPFGLVSCLILLLNGPHPWKDRLTRAALAGAPIALVIIVGVVAKGKGSAYEGTMVGSLDPRVLAATYAKQLVSVLPLSYWLFDPQQLFERMFRDPRLFPQSILAASAVFATVTSALAIGIWNSRIRQSWLLWLTASILVFAPAVMIAVSAKYQRESVAGMGYLQTVISYLGLAMMVAAAAAFAVNRLRSARPVTALAVAATASLAAGAVAAISLLSSYRVAEAINESWRYPREVMDVWMRASPTPQGGGEVIVVDRQVMHRWETQYYLRQQRGTIGRILSRDQFAAEPNGASPDTPVTFLRHPLLPHPGEVSLFLESTPQANGSIIVRAYAISASKGKLRHAAVTLRRGDDRWPLGDAIHFGRHGYYYRSIELRQDSGRPDDFSLESR